MQSVLKFLAICMAGFSEAYYKEGSTFARTTSSMWTSGKYYWNPELRARRIVNISQNAEIDFCKSFWSLAESELMHSLPAVIGTSININKIISIPSEPLQLPRATATATADVDFVNIPIPLAHLGTGAVSARLMSSHRRVGMIGEKGRHCRHAAASALIFHCHGGGFVAQSSKSHELYLRDWAVALDVPIISIDYSLAPAAPFPRAIEEVFYAYCWSLKNAALLGTTAQVVIMAGDSAGANLNLACAIQCIQRQVRRPDGIFLAYCPVRISFDPSPARLLCLMDPLLPFGFMMRCLKAYACPSDAVLEKNRRLVAEQDAIKYAGAGSCGSIGKTPKEDVDEGIDEGCDVVGGATSAEDGSLDGSCSLWEHIENDFSRQEMEKADAAAVAARISPADSPSDTFASASLHSSLTIGNNTEMMTPDESNAVSFEEDSQPIHKDTVTGGNQTEQLNGVAAAAAAAAGGSSVYVDEFVQRYVLDTDADDPILRSVPASRAEEQILLDEGRDMVSMQNIQQKIYAAVESVTTTVSATITAMTASAPIRRIGDGTGGGTTTTTAAYVRNRLDSLIPKSPSEEFVFDIPRDPLLSPFWATDEILKQLPATHILVSWHLKTFKIKQLIVLFADR